MYRKYTREAVADAVQRSTSVVQVLRHLGIQYRSGGAWRMVRTYIDEYGLDISHFKGRGQNKGVVSPFRRAPDQILRVLDGGYRESAVHLRRALIEIGVPYRCAECAQEPVWNGRPMVLPVDHKNGDWWDCRASNLRFMCPNCHSQTSTFAKKKRS